MEVKYSYNDPDHMTALRALLSGHTATIAGLEYRYIKKDEYVYTDSEGNSFGAMSSMLFQKFHDSDEGHRWIGLTDDLSAILGIIGSATPIELDTILSNFSFDMMLRIENSDRYVSMVSVSLINNADNLKELIANAFIEHEAKTLKEAIAQPLYKELQKEGEYPLSFKEFKSDILDSDSFHLVRLINLAQDITDNLYREGYLKLVESDSNGALQYMKV